MQTCGHIQCVDTCVRASCGYSREGQQGDCKAGGITIVTMANQPAVIWHTDLSSEGETSCRCRGHLAASHTPDIDIVLSQNVSEKDTKVPQDEQTNTSKKRIEFDIDETPPFHIAAIYAFQIIFTNLPSSVLGVFILHKALCGGNDFVFMAQLMSSVIFVSGLATLLQVTLGTRLPVTQGSSFIFFPSIIAMMNSDEWRCPVIPEIFENGSAVGNLTVYAEGEEPWRIRLLTVSGGLISASAVEVFLGMSGIIGVLMRFIGPLTLAPTLMLIGLSLSYVATDACKHQWGVAFLMAGLIILFAVKLGDLRIPMITWSKKKGFHVARYPLLRMFSNLLTIGICWLLCHILTITGYLPDDPKAVGYMARTDAKLDAINKIQWFYFPYPGHFGAPRFGVGIFMGMLAATLSSVMESIGDYYATARIAGAPRPPVHAVNRGIAMEGLASVLSGFIGTCHGTTSYSNVIGFIGYTGVASRVPWIMMSLTLMAVGVFGKVAGALATIPEPVIGGMALVGLGLVILVGMAQLHSVDLMSTRNQITLALALMLGMMMPEYMKNNRNVINTGSTIADDVISIFLSTGPFIGGIVGLILDNILPGTKEERGMIPDTDEASHLPEERRRKLYDLPFCTEALSRFSIFSYVPLLPCYTGISCPCSCTPPCVNKRNDNCANGDYSGVADKEPAQKVTSF